MGMWLDATEFHLCDQVPYPYFVRLFFGGERGLTVLSTIQFPITIRIKSGLIFIYTTRKQIEICVISLEIPVTRCSYSFLASVLLLFYFCSTSVLLLFYLRIHGKHEDSVPSFACEHCRYCFPQLCSGKWDI